jgi:DNA-binding NarL/FixJ family response regulator
VSTVTLGGGLALDRQRPEAIRLLSGCQWELERADPLVRAQDLCHAALAWIWLERYDLAERLVDRVVSSARRAGALGVLPQALGVAADLYFRVGRWSDARACAGESIRLARETRQANLYGLYFAARIDAVQGRAEDCERHLAQAVATADRLGVGLVALYAGHGRGLLALGRADTTAAVGYLETVRGLPVAGQIRDPGVVPWVFDLVEAYIRDGRPTDAVALLAEQGPFDDTEGWARAAAARCEALLTDNGGMVEAFARALDAGACATMPFERARTELCLGERLRRAHRRTAARDHLRQALEIFERLGAAPWMDRTRVELRATGETVRRGTDAAVRLTPQELQVALVVGRGATNHEAAAALFLSQKTIEYHLSNIYRKTNIRSRADLATVVG